jgi:hypothetical protein
MHVCKRVAIYVKDVYIHVYIYKFMIYLNYVHITWFDTHTHTYIYLLIRVVDDFIVRE